jgi:hypothetical protein
MTTWTPPRTWLGGEEPDAPTLNIHLRDNLLALTEFDNSWSPVWQSSNGTFLPGTSTSDGHYVHAGDFVWYEAQTTLAGITVGSGNLQLVLPVAAAAAFARPLGALTILSGSTFFQRSASSVGSTTVAQFFSEAGTRMDTNTATPVALVNGTRLSVRGWYRAA